MSDADRRRWDQRYRDLGVSVEDEPAPPPVFASLEHLFPTAGEALELACGRGRASVWLAGRGLTVRGVDVSPVAIDLARLLAARHGLSDRCRFEVVDLDGGLPEGPPADVLLCHMFHDRRLHEAMLERLAVPAGLLAVAVRSEVGAGPGPFRVRPGELVDVFGALEVLAHGEGAGLAWLVARRPTLPQDAHTPRGDPGAYGLE